MALGASTSQTVGPFFHLGLSMLEISDIAGAHATGERIIVEGRVLDGDRNPVPDALIETWQANSYGKYAHEADTQDKPLDPHFRGYGRVATEADGSFRFQTIRPGSVRNPKGAPQAPHIEVSIFMRGLLKQLITRIYFADEPANENDPVLKLVQPERRGTLFAERTEEQPAKYRWNVLLQGPDETVFFEI